MWLILAMICLSPTECPSVHPDDVYFVSKASCELAAQDYLVGGIEAFTDVGRTIIFAEAECVYFEFDYGNTSLQESAWEREANVGN
jgi:hypothetical protein